MGRSPPPPFAVRMCVGCGALRPALRGTGAMREQMSGDAVLIRGDERVAKVVEIGGEAALPVLVEVVSCSGVESTSCPA